MNFSQHIGTSPAGVEWVAYRPEDVAKLTANLERLWARHRAKAAAKATVAKGAGAFIRRLAAELGSCTTLAETEDTIRACLPGSKGALTRAIRALRRHTCGLDEETRRTALEIALDLREDWDEWN